MNDRKISEPQNKRPDRAVNYRQAKRSGLGCSLALAFLLIALGAGIAVGGPRLLTLVNQTNTVSLPLNDQTSPEALAALRNQETAQLTTYGWVDQAAGVAHIPIERALALVAESGLPLGQPANATTSASTEANATALSNVNYQDHILPIFEQHCAECHGADDPEEGLQLTTYQGVMAGSIYGSVVKPGDPENSYLVEMVVTGKMPKKGPDLSPAEIETIVAWIQAGAPERGPASAEATAPEASAAISTTAAATTTVDLANLSFQKDVLPIFVDHCSECHGDDEPEEGLVLTSYKDVMAGSIYGSVVKPGEPDDSYLVEMVATGQMPKRGPDLSPAQIDTIVAWIKAGAPDN